MFYHTMKNIVPILKQAQSLKQRSDLEKSYQRLIGTRKFDEKSGLGPGEKWKVRIKKEILKYIYGDVNFIITLRVSSRELKPLEEPPLKLRPRIPKIMNDAREHYL